VRTAGWWLWLHLTAIISLSSHLYESLPHMMSPSFAFYVFRTRAALVEAKKYQYRRRERKTSITRITFFNY
jgi:hypothetical protein